MMTVRSVSDSNYDTILGSRFQRRIMSRVTPLILVTVMLLGIIALLSIRDAELEALREDNDLARATLNDTVNRAFDGIVEDATDLAISPTVREYARLNVLLENQVLEADPSILRIQVLSAFDDIISLNRRYYQAVRYVDPLNEINLEVVNQGTETDIRSVSEQVFIGNVLPEIPMTPDLPTLWELRAPAPGEEWSTMVITIPITERGQVNNILGVIYLEVTTEIISDAIDAVLEDPRIQSEGREALIVDSENNLILDNTSGVDTETYLQVLRDNSGALSRENIEDNISISADLLDDYTGATLPWRVILVDDANDTLTSLYTTLILVGIAFFLTALALVVLVWLLMSRLLRPLTTVTTVAETLAAGSTSRRTENIEEFDEVERLVSAVNNIAQRINIMGDTLQTRNQRHNRDLEVVARIGREVATVQDIDLLMNRTINLISDEFGFYHAQIFLVDDARINAVLVNSRGKAGQELLKLNFKILIGSDSVIGTVTGRGQPVIVNDTNKRAGVPHRQNPLLPDTRAELGLPLLVDDEVIGALDIQSTEPDVFNERDLPIFALIADQLAVAIYKTRLIEQSERRVRQIDTLNSQLIRKAWNESELEGLDRTYQYNLLNVERAHHSNGDPKPSLTSEIRIRNEVVGTLSATMDSSQELTQGDEVILQAVANRVALAIENARLFQETQSTLSETSTLYELSRALNEANTLNDIMKAIIETIVTDAIGGQIWMFEEDYMLDEPEWVEAASDLALNTRVENNEDITGARLFLPDHPFLNGLDPTHVRLITNVREDARLDSGLKLTFRRVGAEAALIIPLSVRGSWRGFMALNFPKPRAFSEREGRVYSALTDQAGVAIDNRLLLQQTEEEVARNENLYAASRIINTAQNMADLVYAAVATTNDPTLDFKLNLLEGELDEQGWPTRARTVAVSDNRTARETNEPTEIIITDDSPMRDRRPELVLDDTPTNPNVSEIVLWIRERGLRFAAFFPLFNMNQPIAIFQITSSEPYDLQTSDYEVYRALTGQMSSQIQIRGLLERTEAALDETRRLYLAAQSIIAAEDQQGLYEATIEHLARPFLQQQVDGQPIPTTQISILFARPNTTPDAPTLEYAFSWSSDAGTNTATQIGKQIKSTDFPYGKLTSQANGTVYFRDVIADDGDDSVLATVPSLRAYLLDNDIGSMVIQPIRSRQQWFGVIVGEGQRANTFDEQYIRFMVAIADQVALSVENQRLFDQARFEAERAQSEAQRAIALAEASQLASRIGDNFEESLSEVFERVAREAGFDRWMLLFLDDARENLAKITVEAPGFDNTQELSYSLDTSIPVVEVVKLNQSVTVNDPLTYPSFQTFGDIERKGIAHFFGKHIATPVRIGGIPFGSLFVGRGTDRDDLDQRDEQLVETLAVQVAIAVENRQLFERVQREQQSLRAILETLPAGVLVLDPDTLKPVQFNQQAENLLGREIDLDEAFTVEGYNLYRTGTQLHYPDDEMAIFNALDRKTQETVDDVAVIIGNRQTDIQVAASPVTDPAGNVLFVVAAFQDISNLRSLENTLQENLRETVANLETQRQLAEAENLDEVLQVIVFQLAMVMQPLDAYVLMMRDNGMISADHQLVQPLDYPEMLHPLLDTSQSINLPDITQAEMADELRAIFDEMGAKSLLTMPLRVGTREDAVGWVMVVSDQIGAYTGEQERQMSQLVDMSSTAIDNRLLIQKQQATVAEVQLLYTATNNISRSTRDIDELATILKETLGNIKPDYYAAYVDDDSAETLNELFNITSAGLKSVNFGDLLTDYELPSKGLFINDLLAVEQPDTVQQKFIQNGVRSLAAINLRPKDVPGGFIVIAYEQPHHFAEAEERFMNTVADAASIVFNNILLFGQTQATLEETSVLYQASKALSDATNPEEIIDVVVNYLVATHVNQVFIALLNGDRWDAPNAAVNIVASWSEDDGVDLEGVTLTNDQFPAWQQLASPEVLTINDIYDEAIGLDMMEQTGIESLDARSLTIVPLRVPKRAIGAVWIGSREAHEYTERELRMFQAFAEQASLSLEAAYLLQQTERRARQLQTSAEVSQSASQILDLEELLPQLVQLIQESFGYDHVQIFLMDERDDFAILRASTGEAGEQLLGIAHKLQKGSDSVIGQVTETAKPAIALDTADANVVHQPNPYLPLTRSEMALPLIIKGRVVGALDVQSNQPNAFGQEDVDALTLLAAQISVAIDNADLYESAQQQANRMGFLFEITSTAASGDNLEDLLSDVTESLRVNMDTLSVIAYLPQVYMNDEADEFATIKAIAISGAAQPLSGIEEIRLDDETNLLAEIGRSMQPFVIDNIARNEAYLPVAAEARSAAILPLVSSGELIGLIVLEDSRQGAYDYDTLQLLLTLGGSLSAIVQSAQLLEQLTQTTEQLRELDRLKSDFLANMSHELRTPLNSIIGFSRVMLKGIDGPLTEMQEQDLTTIYNSGQHLLTLINEILDQAKIAADKLDLKLDYFEIKPVIEAVRSIGLGLVKEKNLSLIAEMAPNLGNVYGDEVRTRQILINLVSNAAKFTSEGGIKIRVYPVQNPDSGMNMVRIDVEDTGIGIAKKDLPLLFEAFRQVDSSLTRTQGGTGLGLPIAKSLTELQGGEMFVNSEVTAGSTFSITIPTGPWKDEDLEGNSDELEIDELDPPSKPTMEMKALSSSNFSGPPPQMLAKREVLLIEDNKDMVDQFRRALQREGFDVTTADHPAYAEAMASNLRPTVIVMDVNFAGEQGWTILQSLKDRDDTFDIPIVVCTLSDESERAYQTGAHSFIQRPFVPDDLVNAVLEAEEESNTQRILIIDDQPEAVRLLTEALNESGTFRVFSADNGKEGVSLVARRRPDLIILDLRMPEMDGFAVLQELRSNPETANIPVMVVTGEIDLNADEQKQLSNVRVLHKTNISEEEYDQFIAGVRNELDMNE